MDQRDRDRHDYRWQLYPFEHPRAYWLRSDESEVICTRCGGRCVAGRDFDLGEDPSAKVEAFVAKHLNCPLGYGVNGIGITRPAPTRGPDPLLMGA